MSKNTTPKTNHRTIVGAQRRNNTRLKLLECALNVLHRKGVEGNAVIEDFIAEAAVSRGTFYNYFNTTDELLLALATEMSGEILAVIDPIVLQCKNPVERFVTGTRLYMEIAHKYPLWGSFVNLVGTRIATRGQLVEKNLTRDLGLAIKQKLIKTDNLVVARDLVLGSIYYGIDTMTTDPTLKDHPEHLIESILVGLHVPPNTAKELAFKPLNYPKSINGPIFSKLKPKTIRQSSKK